MSEEQKIHFSILMANYNNSQFIDKSIKSVLSQTYPYWELIIVDDCSSDDSIGVINTYLTDKRIKLIRHDKNWGYGATLKTAIQMANYEHIAILDSDDLLHTTSLEIMAQAYKNYPHFGFIYSTMWRCDQHLKNCRIDTMITDVDVNKKNWLMNPPISHFKTFRRNDYLKTKGFERFQRKAVDKDLFYKLSEVTQFKFINIPLYYYRQHSTGISQGAHKFTTKYFAYMAKYKAYKRRLNSKLPNFEYKELRFFYYYNIVFFNIVRFFIDLFFRCKLELMLNKAIKLMPGEIIKARIMNFKSHYIDIFG
jgi:glycosyltransferase involved in cell wall biosynthesis